MIQEWPQGPIPYPGYPVPAPTPSRWATVTIIVAGVIALLALGGCGFLGWKLAGDRREMPSESAEVHTAGGQALEAARAFATLLTNVDYRELDRSTAQVLENSTGDFKNAYAKSSADLRRTMVQNKAKATGLVVESAIQSGSATQVTVLLFIDQSVTNVALSEPRLDRSRVRMTMEKVDGRWLTSKVDLL
ncbi:Mce protein [Mycobacteroides chelonae]|uniref:Mce protein n=1 Tax=Mycobacteroides chelonae TaxID=1774 RepID=UPI000ABADBFA|nr:Mce protein [Mycobacteroides chelonae]QQG85820.1 Mce protein [Mycobacteroides chelonae]QQG90635.1 Mce protein [Mycobacteroides chelonae]